MKRMLLCFAGIVLMIFSAVAQSDIQTSILTDIGIITISKTTDDKDKILMSIKNWDEMVAGTKYSAAFLPASKRKKLCIEIASREKGNCRTGIGFGCSIFDCPYVPDPLPNRVDAGNRICAVAVRKIKGSIEIIFIDRVNWKSFEKH